MVKTTIRMPGKQIKSTDFKYENYETFFKIHQRFINFLAIIRNTFG